MGGRKVGFLYKDEKGLDDAIQATRITLGINQATGERLIGAGRTVFAKVVALRADTDDKQATAVTVVYNATTRAFETDDDLIFDSDNATEDSHPKSACDARKVFRISCGGSDVEKTDRCVCRARHDGRGGDGSRHTPQRWADGSQ